MKGNEAIALGSVCGLLERRSCVEREILSLLQI